MVIGQRMGSLEHTVASVCLGERHLVPSGARRKVMPLANQQQEKRAGKTGMGRVVPIGHLESRRPRVVPDTFGRLGS
jgi:hypothetical protein